MPGNGIPLDKAALLSVLMESLLYGFSLLMFGGTICAVWSRRPLHQVNRSMLAVACLLLLVSTMHLVIDIIRIMEGLILLRDTFPGGPIEYFSDLSQWSFAYKNYLYTAQTLIGDGVILYRCYAVWQSKLVMIVPALFWCTVGVTGIGSTYTASHVVRNKTVFSLDLSSWITSFYASTLITNLLTTLLLAYRIWSIDRATVRLCGHKSQLRSILHIVIDAGAIYSVTLIAALIGFVNRSNSQCIILEMITPIISITFYMVITRIGLVNAENHAATTLPLRFAAAGDTGDLGTDISSGMQVHTTTFTESKIENRP